MLESRPQQALVKGKQRLVDRKNIVLLLPDEILDDDVKLTAAAQRMPARAMKSRVSSKPSSSTMANAMAVDLEG